MGIASSMSPATQSLRGMLTSQAGVGSEALGVVAILPVSRGILSPSCWNALMSQNLTFFGKA